ncbi:hypothetical protein WA171_006464 [Blastocystis sp. BT1]
MNSILLIFLFLASGVVDTLCAQRIVYLGATNMRSMFSLFAYYFSSALIGLSPIQFADVSPSGSDQQKLSRDDIESQLLLQRESDVVIKESKSIQNSSRALRIAYVATALCDFTGYIIRTIGLSYCGSGLFQVAFSSVAIWSALFSFVFLKRKISPLQWLGILIVTFGLILSPLSTNTSGNSPLTGILLTLLGAQFYALSYILNEYISTLPGNKGSKETCKWIGIINTSISLLLICFDTYPHRQTLILRPLLSHHATLTMALKATGLYILSHFVHSWALFSIQGVLGAVWTGLLQCVRACVVFLVSSYLFCKMDVNQCLTTSKAVATIIVCLGILIFNKGKIQA